MNYDKVKDEYTCHNNKKLKVIDIKKRKSKPGYQASVTVYECEDCDACQYKPKCTKAKGNNKNSDFILLLQK